MLLERYEDDDHHDTFDPRPDTSFSLPVAAKAGDLARILKKQRPFTASCRTQIIIFLFVLSMDAGDIFKVNG